MVCFFISSGSIYEGLKKLLKLILDIILKLANACGIQLQKRERNIHVSRQFKHTFKDIRIVKKSKENNKLKPSINLFALSLFIISLGLIIANLQVVSGNALSIWLFDNNILSDIINSQRDMDMVFTTSLFSILSFSISKVISQWKETAKDRAARREMKKTEYLIKHSTSRDLIDAAKLKDLEKYEQLVKKSDE